MPAFPRSFPTLLPQFIRAITFLLPYIRVALLCRFFIHHPIKPAPNLPLEISGFPACRCIFPTQAACIYFPRGKFVPRLRGKAIFSPKQIGRILPVIFLFHFIFFCFICGRAGKLHPLKNLIRLRPFCPTLKHNLPVIYLQYYGRWGVCSRFFVYSITHNIVRCYIVSVCIVVPLFGTCTYLLHYLPNKVAAVLYRRTFNQSNTSSL